MPLHHLILDVETQKIFDQVGGYYPEKLGISFVGVIERSGLPEAGEVKETRHQFFEADLPQLWPLLEHTDVIIGFNLIGFDLPALSPYYPGDIANLPALDLMDQVKQSYGHRISLDAIAKVTLNSQKTGTGLDAINYFETGQLDKLAQYCMKDVEITRDLYDYGRRQGHVSFLNRWNNRIQVPVDFSFTPLKGNDVQLTLM